MIVRLIAETLTPIVSKSRFLKIRGARGVVSNRPYLGLQEPTRHRGRTTFIVKQGAQGFPFHHRAQMGYLHLDFKTRTPQQTRRKLKAFLQLQCVGEFTSWGYGRLGWILQKTYHTHEPAQSWGSRFRILKGLPPKLAPRERQLVMAALLHDLVDTDLHPSKLGRPLIIPNPYVQWLCTHHHASQRYPTNPDLQLLQDADSRTSSYARILALSTPRRKMAPVNTSKLATLLEQAVQKSVYQLYTVIYQSEALNNLTASKAHPTESLRNHLLGVANWTLFLLRKHLSIHSDALASLAGEPGGIPGPVEMEDPGDKDEPFASW